MPRAQGGFSPRAITQAFSQVVRMDHLARQTVGAAAGDLVLKIATSGHVDGVVLEIDIPAGHATSLTLAPDLNLSPASDAFDAAKNYRLRIAYAGGIFYSFGQLGAVRDTTKPTIVSITVPNLDPDGLVIVFSEAVFDLDLVGLTLAFSAGTPRTIIALESGQDTNTLTFTLSGVVAGTDVLTFSASAANTIQDENGNALAAVVAHAVTNNAP